MVLEEGAFNMLLLSMNILEGAILKFQGKRFYERNSDQEKSSDSVSPLNVELPNVLF